MNDIAIVYNKKGGSTNVSTVESLAKELRLLGYRVNVLGTTPEPFSAGKLALSASQEGAQLVIAFGGDGTVCQVAEGLLGTGTAMAAYHGGTGNLFANSYYSRLTPSQFARMIAAGRPQPVDMIRLDYTDVHGEQHHRLFMTALGLGPLSDSTLISQDIKRVFGKLAYVFGVSKASIGVRPVKFSLELEDLGVKRQRDVAAAVFAVTNVLPPAYSLFSRGCNASDGLMDATYLAANRFVDLLRTAFWLPFGRPERSPFYGRMRTAKLTVKTDKPVIPNIDGDASPATRELTLTVEPGAAKMILL